MVTHEETHVDDGGLSTELSRQLVHDFRNFLYNLFLQIEIWETAPASKRTDWSMVKRECDQLTQSLRQWELHHRRGAPQTAAVIDLNQLLRNVAADLAVQDPSASFSVALGEEPLWFTGYPVETRLLVRLVLEDFLLYRREEGDPEQTISIRAEQKEQSVMASFSEAPPDGGSLLQAACRSLSQRLDAAVRREVQGEGRAAVVIEFPTRVSD